MFWQSPNVYNRRRSPERSQKVSREALSIQEDLGAVLDKLSASQIIPMRFYWTSEYTKVPQKLQLSRR